MPSPELADRQGLDPAEVAAFGVALDPMRPQEITPPPGLMSRPPLCPTDRTFLQMVNTNPMGDVLLECLGCGYQAIFRVQTGTYEQPVWAAGRANFLSNSTPNASTPPPEWTAPGTPRHPIDGGGGTMRSRKQPVR